MTTSPARNFLLDAMTTVVALAAFATAFDHPPGAWRNDPPPPAA